MGLGHFLEGVGDAVTNVAKGVAYVANPTHLDDIAKGVGKAGEFVLEHPGQVAHIAGEVGKGIIKDQLNPVNLAINGALIAATVASGGLAAPALAAKLGIGVKSIEAGIEAGKAVETGVDVVKGVQAGVKGAQAIGEGAKALEAAGTGAKAIEAGSAATKAVEAGSAATKAVEAGSTATKAVEGVEAGTKAAGELSKTGKVLKYVDKALGAEPGALSKAMNPIENSRFGLSALRERAAAKVLEGGGEAPSLARQVGAALVQGSGRGTGMTTQLPGMSDEVYAAQKMAWRAGAIEKRAGQAEGAAHKVEVAADPMKAVEGRAYKEADKRGIGRDAGYTDPGQTATGMYGNRTQGEQTGFQATSQVASQKAIGAGTPAGTPARAAQVGPPATSSQVGSPNGGLTYSMGGDVTRNGRTSYEPGGWVDQQGKMVISTQDQINKTQAQINANGQVGGRQSAFQAGTQATSPYSQQGAGGNAFGGPPTTPPGGKTTGGSAFGPPDPNKNSTASTATPSDQSNQAAQPSERAGGSKTSGKTKGGGGGRRGMHFYEGPRSQWAGGIHSNYDWRHIDPLRPISVPGSRTQKRGQRSAAGDEVDQPGTDGDINEQGAPKDFAPEMDKMKAISTGQQPNGSAFPKMIGTAPKSYTATNVRTRQQPVGALNSGQKAIGAGQNFIDADSHDPEDYKFDNSGQGYFDFANMGSGTADVGFQPNTAPLYQPNASRTSRRGVGSGATLGV